MMMSDDNRIDFPKGVIPRSDTKVQMPEGSPAPRLLRVPDHFHSVDDVLATAAKMNLPNVLVLSELDDGRIVFLDDGLNLAQTNWLLDRMKMVLLTPAIFEKSK